MNAKTIRRAVVAILAVYLVAMVGLGARAQSSQRWDHYRSRNSGNVLVVKGRCIGAEDSAAHLRLIDYRDNGGHIVYGCSRKGF
jgi:hypothetical protein